MLPFLTEEFGNPSSAHCVRATCPRGAGRRPRRPRHGPPRPGPRDRLHVGWHRGEQPRHQGRRLGGPRPGPPNRHHRGRAPRRPAHGPLPREVRLRDRGTARGPLRPRRPRPARCRDHGQDDPRVGEYANNEVGTIQPMADIVERVRGHHGVLLHVDAVQAAPHWTGPRRARWEPTSSGGRGPQVRRAQGRRARCTSDTARISSRSSRAAARNGTAGRARRTSPGRSAWRAPTS